MACDTDCTATIEVDSIFVADSGTLDGKACSKSGVKYTCSFPGKVEAAGTFTFSLKNVYVNLEGKLQSDFTTGEVQNFIKRADVGGVLASLEDVVNCGSRNCAGCTTENCIFDVSPILKRQTKDYFSVEEVYVWPNNERPDDTADSWPYVDLLIKFKTSSQIYGSGGEVELTIPTEY